MGQIWLQDDTAQVEIIELDSDESEIESNRDQDINYGDVWNYFDKDRFTLPSPDFYQANKKARENRRMHYTNNFKHEGSSERFDNEVSGVVNDIVISSFYDFTNDLPDKNIRNHQTNCFTIINKPFNTPESSSDEIDYKERVNTPDHNGAPYDGEVITFDEDIESAKRTIWIYSFRNKRVLSENDFELVNIPSQDSASSTSFSLDNFTEESTKTCRVSSPIPAAYVPRINLSAATPLPTLTEVTEPTRDFDNARSASDKNTSMQLKQGNNWFGSEVINRKSSEKDQQDKSSSTNVINWMCLSPRERRRRFRHTSIAYQPILPVLSEIPSSEPKSQNSHKDAVVKLQITAEINSVENKYATVQTQTEKRSLLKCKVRSHDEDNITIEDVEGDDTKTEADLNLLQKPKIMVNSDRSNNIIITDPIEKLHSNNWIHEEARKVKPNTLDTSTPKTIELNNDTYVKSSEECAGNKLWIRNMSLLKPVEWTQYMPITDSIPSLHLSIGSDPGKLTWLKRLAKCFRCLK